MGRARQWQEMNTVSNNSDNALWADLFSQLSEFFKEPSREFADDVASGRLLWFFKGHGHLCLQDDGLLNGLMLGDDAYGTLSEEYRRLFFGPMPPYIVPVESVYKRWTNDPECGLPMASERGYLMGDPAIDMTRRYLAHGIALPEKYSSMPDHIALELEYASFLCSNDSAEGQREFVFSHLDWVADFADDVKSLAAAGGFYCSAAEITLKTISVISSKLSCPSV